jgi:hypothetical protein
MVETTEVIDPPQDILWEKISRDNFPLLHGDLKWFFNESKNNDREGEWFHAFLDKYPLHFPSKTRMGYCREIILSSNGWYDVDYFVGERLSELRKSQAPCIFYGEWDKLLLDTCGSQSKEVLELTTHMGELEKKADDELKSLSDNEITKIKRIVKKLSPERIRPFMLKHFEHLYGIGHDEDCVNLLLLTARFYEEMRNKGYNHLDLVL